MAKLDRFLEEASQRPFDDARWNCALMVAAWVGQVTGVDVAAPWRSRFTSRLGWLRLLRREGGLLAVCEKAAGIAGLAETQTPLRGDVGVVARVPDGELLAAISLGRTWAAPGAKGVRGYRAVPVKIWRVENSCE